MAVPVPFSTAYMLLLLALPGVWWLGRAIAHEISRDRALRAVLGAGLAVVLGLLGVHVASLAAGSLRVGLPLGLLALAAAGGVVAVARKGRSDRAEGGPTSPWMWLTMLAATAAMTPLALDYHLHDEPLLTGHMSLAAQIQTGMYPPRHLTFPEWPLRYHHGFDLVSASVSALLHLRVDAAIDAATLGLFALSWCLFWVLGERLISRSRAWLVPLLALFGGGLPVACDNQAGFLSRVVTSCDVGKHYVNPPLPSYFFQHPWSLGVPLGVTCLLVLTSHRPPRARVRLAALALGLAALSLGQITLFAGFVPSFLVAEAWGQDGLDLRRGGEALVALVVAVVAAKLLGGFLTSTPGMPGLAFSLHPGFGDSAAETFRWNVLTFGALLPLGALGFLVLRRDRVVLGLLVAGSFAVLNTVHFAGSEDIMKFATLGSIALAVLAAAALARFLPERTEVRPRPPPWGAALAGGLGLASCLWGGVFVAAMDTHVEQVPPYLRVVPVQPGAADAQILTWMRYVIKPGELVYRDEPAGWTYAQWGGIPVPWLQWTVKAFGFPQERIAARESLLAARPAEVETWRREGIRFLVLDRESELDWPLQEHAEAWIARGQARQVMEVDDLVVVELLP